MRPPIRETYPVAEIDPLSLVPNPGLMTELYVDVSQLPEQAGGISDGMQLATATPLRPYAEIQAAYVAEREQPGFSPAAFWHVNFATPEPGVETYYGPRGMALDEYLDIVRPTFERRGSDHGAGFDIPIPFDHLVAGGRFPQFFPTDGYYEAKGCAARGDWEKVRGVAETMAYLIRMLKRVPNGAAGYYASRPQEPRFAHVVRMIAEQDGAEALVDYLPEMETEYGDWMEGEAALSKLPMGSTYTHRFLFRTADGRIGNRYWDDSRGPRFEMLATDWLEANAVADTQGLEGADREAYMESMWKEKKIVAASKWDFSSRWRDPESGELIASRIAPVDLQSQMRYMEETLAMANQAAGDERRAYGYWLRVQARDELINQLHWDSETGVFRDYNFVEGRQTSVLSMAMAAPLYVGMTNPEQTMRVADAERKYLLRPGGFMVTVNHDTGDQWDAPYSWIGPNWDGSRAPARMRYKLGHLLTKGQCADLIELSKDGRAATMHGIEESYDAFRCVRERINAENPRQDIGGENNEYKTVDLLGMTLGGYEALKAWDPDDATGCLPIGCLALKGASTA